MQVAWRVKSSFLLDFDHDSIVRVYARGIKEMNKDNKKNGKPEKIEFPLTVVLVRHAQANLQNISMELGPLLSPLGQRQAARVAKRLSKEKFDHIYTSDMPRAYFTAQPILKFHKNTLFTVTPNIREIMHYHFTPGPIPQDPVIRKHVMIEQERVEKFAMRLRHTHKPGEKILVICHGNFIRTLVPMLAGRSAKKSVLIDINNTAVTILEVWPSGEAVLRLANCVNHLLPGQVT